MLRICLGMEYICHKLCVCSVLIDNTKPTSKVVVTIYFPPALVIAYICLIQEDPTVVLKFVNELIHENAVKMQCPTTMYRIDNPQ